MYFSKANTKFCLSLHYKSDESYLYANKTEISKFEAKDNINWYNSCIGGISQDFTKIEQSEITSNGTVYDFSFDHSSIEKEDIFNMHRYLMIQNNIKCLDLFKKCLLDY